MVETNCASVEWDDRGFARVNIKPGTEMVLEDLKDNLEARIKVSDNRMHALLLDISRMKSISHDSRRFASSKEMADNTRAIALLTLSHVSKVIGNFFIGINKPPYPVKLFTSEEKAIAWLQGFKD